MKSVERIIPVLLSLAFISGAFPFVSCNDGGVESTPNTPDTPDENEEHVHAFEWESDGEAHWQICECGERGDVEAHVSGGEATHDEAETCTVCGYEISEKLKVFNGQRVLIIGNSYVFWGNAVIYKNTDVTDQSKRDNDKGFFYQFCQDNGRDVFVTNWTYGGYALHHLLADKCTMTRKAGCKSGNACHRTDLVNLDYDYVIVSPGCGSEEEETFAKSFDQIKNMFKAANPDVEIICLGNLGAHGISSIQKDHPGIYESYATLEKEGIIIADWGQMVFDIINGDVVVPGAKFTYTKNTFIAPDGYHPNQLSAYIQCLMAYCAITGESAVGQPYEFCFDTSKNSKFTLNPFQYVKKSDYPDYTTNMPDVFASPEDMLGIQMLIDQYLAEKPYRN